MNTPTPERDMLRRHGRALATAVAGGPVSGGEIGVSVLKRSEFAVVMRVRAGGQERYAKLLLRAPGEGADGFGPETTCLRALAGTGLAPELVAALPKARCIVTELVEGVPLSEVLTRENLQQRARQIGVWAGKVAAHLPGEEIPGNWWDYLARVEHPDLAGAIAPHRPLFESLPLVKTTIAHNDGHLSNFIVTGEGGLIGLDFAAARLKPVGWDLLLAGRSLARALPGHGAVIAPALISGWKGASTEPAPHPDLVRVFAEATGFPG